MTSQYCAYALHVGLARLHAHAHASGYPHARTHRPVSNTYCFSTARNDSRTRVNVTVYVHCLSCLFMSLLDSVSEVSGPFIVSCKCGVVGFLFVKDVN